MFLCCTLKIGAFDRNHFPVVFSVRSMETTQENIEKVALIPPRNFKVDPEMACSRHRNQPANYHTLIKTKFFWRLIIFLVCCQALLILMRCIRQDQQRSQYKESIIVHTSEQDAFQLTAEDDTFTEANQIQFEPSKNYFPYQEGKESSKRIVIGAVSCSRKADDHLFLENTLVMMKSVVISAKLNAVEDLDFHLFLEYPEHEQVFRDKVANWFDPETNSVEVSMTFYNAVDIVPEKHRDYMVYHHRFRCGYVRMFFPSSLPNVESLIYLDADVIVTGNVLKLWNQFYKMTDTQLIGVGKDQEEENTFYEYLPGKLFGKLPYVPPKGVNSGVLLMNLTKMRAFGWEEKMLKLNADYGQIGNINDQILLNVMLYYNPYLVMILDCSFNFIHTHCDKGLVCPAVETDPVGINLIHGANRTFQVGGVFRPIWESYFKFNPSEDNLRVDLMDRLKQVYQASSSQWSLCYGALDKYLFKVGIQGNSENVMNNQVGSQAIGTYQQNLFSPFTAQPITGPHQYTKDVVTNSRMDVKGDSKQIPLEPVMWYFQPTPPPISTPIKYVKGNQFPHVTVHGRQFK